MAAVKLGSIAATTNIYPRQELDNMDDETKTLLRSIAHHLKWVIVLLIAIIAMLLAKGVAGN